jgi:hypothetical protein
MSLFLNENKEIVNAPVKGKEQRNYQQENFFSEIQDFFKYLPWFKENVNHIYISPLCENSKKLIIEKDLVQDSKGNFFYKPNRRYYNAQLNAEKKEQDGVKYSIFVKEADGSLTKYSMIIGIITDKGLSHQNQDIFFAQEKFLKNWKSGNRESEKEKLLNSKIDENFTIFFENFLKKNNITDIGYIKEIVERYSKMYGHSGKLFIDRVLDLMIFINPKLSLIHSTNFTKRFEKQYYKPQILPFLTEKEKLEEIFNDKLMPDETISLISDILLKHRESLYTDWINYLLVSTTGARRIQTVKRDKPTFVDLPPWKKVCKNAQDLINQDEGNIVYVSENDNIYGFTINQMFKIIKKDCKNPYTQVLFSKEFVSKFLDTFYEPQEKMESQQSFTQKSEAISINYLESLLEYHLQLNEKSQVNCSQCGNITLSEKYFIKNTKNDIFFFCSGECMTQYNFQKLDELTKNEKVSESFSSKKRLARFPKKV